MGTNYTFGVALGYRVSVMALYRLFKHVVPAQFEKRPHFDPDSGVKLPDKKVQIKAAKEYFLFEGNQYEDDLELWEVIAEAAGCEADLSGYWNSYAEENTVIFHLNFSMIGQSDDTGNITIGKDLDLSNLNITELKKLQQLGKILQKHGVEPGPLRACLNWSVS